MKGSRRRGFGRIAKQKSGKYRAAYIGPDGILYWHPAAFGTRGQAEAWLNAEERLVLLETWSSPAAREAGAKAKAEAARVSTLTFGEYADTWLDDKANRNPSDREFLRPSSVKDYTALLKNHLKPTLGDRQLASLTTTDILTWHRMMGRKKIPRATAKAYSLLHGILADVVRDPALPLKANPCTIVGAGRCVVKHEIVLLEPEQVEDLAANMPERLRLAVLLSFWCSLRYGEMAGLTRADVVLPAEGEEEDEEESGLGLLRVRRGVVWVPGREIADKPKTPAGRRDLHIPPHLLPAVRHHLRDHVEPGPGALLFPGPNGGHLKPATFQTPWHKARAASGFPTLRFHDLRHSGLTAAALAGAITAELMARGGQSTPAMALYYQHASAQRDAEIARRLSKLI